jgi:DNA-binding transcriptional ArsR family regulator
MTHFLSYSFVWLRRLSISCTSLSTAPVNYESSVGEILGVARWPCYGKYRMTVSQDLLSPELDAVLDALGDRTRRAILRRILDSPRSVAEIAEDLPVSRPAVSQHLRVLKAAGLVVDRPAGNRRVYAVDPGGLVELRRFLERFWEDALRRFATFAESGVNAIPE